MAAVALRENNTIERPAALLSRADDRSGHQRRLPMAGNQVLALPDTARR